MRSWESSARDQKLAVTVLMLGVLGQLAYGWIVYNSATGKNGTAALSILAWLRVLPFACWTVLFVQGRGRRWVVGSLAFVMSVILVYLSETRPAEWFPRPHKHDTENVSSAPRVGAVLSFPQLFDLDGNSFDLTLYGARPVVLSIWRSWCGPCRKEMPDLNRLDGLESTFGPIAVIGMNDEPLSVQKQVRDSEGITFRLVRHDERATAFQAERLPTTIVVRNGIVVARWVGTEPELARRVMSALTGPSR